MRHAVRGGPPATSGKARLERAAQYGLAVAAVALGTAVRWSLARYFGPHFTFVTLYPAVLLAASIGGGGPGIVATVLAALAADYLFLPPFGFGIQAPADMVALGIFTGANLLLCVLPERLRRARWAKAVSATQEQQLALLDLGNLLALDLDHRITRWSEGCRRLYGFDRQEAEGRFAHELLQTRFPQPPEELQRTLLERGHWEGELVRRRKDGTEAVVAVLWALRRDGRGRASPNGTAQPTRRGNATGPLWP